jgi:hypothetical protein
VIRACFILLASVFALSCTDGARRDVALREALAEARAAARPQPLTANSLGDAAAIRAVLARDFSAAIPQLGGVEYTVVHRARVRDDAGADEATLDETTTLKVAENGDFALDHQLKWMVRGDGQGQDGRRCWRVGDRYFTAGLYGAATQVPVVAEEDQRCLGSALRPLKTLLDRSLDDLALSTGSPGVVLDRPTQHLLGQWTQRPVRVPAAVPEAFGSRHRDRALQSKAIFNGPRRPLLFDFTDQRAGSVSVVWDAQTGVPLQAQVQSVFAIRKLSRSGRLELTLQVQVKRLESTVQAPENPRIWQPRDRPFEDQAALLGPLEAQPDAALPQPGEAPTLGLTVDEVELEQTADVPVDAGAQDAGPPAAPDAAVPDAAAPDAAAPDAAAPDAAAPDAAAPDEDAPDPPPPARDEDAP